MYEWKRYGANALDLHHHMLVAAYAACITSVTFEGPGLDAHTVARPEIVLAVDLATCGVVDGK